MSKDTQNQAVSLSRRTALFSSVGAAAAAVAVPLAALSTAAQAAPVVKGGPVAHSVSTITTRDGGDSGCGGPGAAEQGGAAGQVDSGGFSGVVHDGLPFS